jgi:hypothetical protein
LRRSISKRAGTTRTVLILKFTVVHLDWNKSPDLQDVCGGPVGVLCGTAKGKRH